MRKFDLTAIKDDGVLIQQGDSTLQPMPEPVQVPRELDRYGQPDSIWIYRTIEGVAVGAVMRWNPIDGGDKVIRPVIWNGERYVTSGLGENRPLLNAPMIAAAPMSTVLLVEGEKTADAAGLYLPQGFCASTWSGGANAWKKTDYSILRGHPVLVWPDNDEPGIGTGKSIVSHLISMGISAQLITPPSRFPKGWDLADPLPDVTEDFIRNVIERTAFLMRKREQEEKPKVELSVVPRSVLIPEDEEGEVEELPEEDTYVHYRAIGYNEQRYYVMPAAQKQPHPYTAKQLMSEEGCIEIVNSHAYWEEHFSDDKGRVNWKRAGAFIMKQCTDAGVYSPNKLRDQGVWYDRGRVVLHFGTKLFVDGTEMNPAKLKSTYIYPSRDDMLDDWNGFDDMAPNDYGRSIRAACNHIRWEKKIYGDLLAGWIATAPICGALPWRTHAWITGNASSGKTTVITEIVTPCLGGVAVYPVGNSTEAGIRQSIGNRAVPVVFDESEAKQNKEEQRQAVIQLMRQSSAETRGRIMKGSANHQSVTFTLRSAFLMSSIGVGLKEAADLTRTAVLTVRPLSATTTTERREQEDQWKALQAACALIPHDTPQKLLARQVSNLMTVRKNVEIFKEVIAINLGNRRLGDQLGTLLAGLVSLYSTNVVSKQMCEKFLEQYDWTDFTTVRTMREDLALLYHLANSRIRVETSSGYHERLIGELIEVIFNRLDDGVVNPNNAENTLKRIGIRVDHKMNGIWIGTSVSGMKSIMATSEYNEGWGRVILRHPYAQKSNGSLKFAGVNSHAVFIPKQEFFKIEG